MMQYWKICNFFTFFVARVCRVYWAFVIHFVWVVGCYSWSFWILIVMFWSKKGFLVKISIFFKFFWTLNDSNVFRSSLDTPKLKFVQNNEKLKLNKTALNQSTISSFLGFFSNNQSVNVILRPEAEFSHWWSAIYHVLMLWI